MIIIRKNYSGVSNLLENINLEHTKEKERTTEKDRGYPSIRKLIRNEDHLSNSPKYNR